VAANWKFTAGLAVGLGLLVHVALMRKRGVAIVPADLVGRVYAALGILAVVTVLWAGSFEIDHYFGMHGRRWEDPGLARQMALSLWWGVYAAALLVIGLSRRAPALRYVAIVLLAITLGKVFLVDMRGVEAVYRILSFLGLGTVLLAASWLYHRYFRSPPASARPAGLGPEGPEQSSRE
jgi:uncharacterized membrane protein